MSTRIHGTSGTPSAAPPANDGKAPAWMDLSVPIYAGMVHWPDSPAVRVEGLQDLSHGDAANVSTLEMGAHTSTHMDAPRHCLADGAGLDELPLDATIGLARVIAIAHSRAVVPADLEAHRLQAGERVLGAIELSGSRPLVPAAIKRVM